MKCPPRIMCALWSPLCSIILGGGRNISKLSLVGESISPWGYPGKLCPVLGLILSVLASCPWLGEQPPMWSWFSASLSLESMEREVMDWRHETKTSFLLFSCSAKHFVTLMKSWPTGCLIHILTKICQPELLSSLPQTFSCWTKAKLQRALHSSSFLGPKSCSSPPYHYSLYVFNSK